MNDRKRVEELVRLLMEAADLEEWSIGVRSPPTLGTFHHLPLSFLSMIEFLEDPLSSDSFPSGRGGWGDLYDWVTCVEFASSC